MLKVDRPAGIEKGCAHEAKPYVGCTSLFLKSTRNGPPQVTPLTSAPVSFWTTTFALTCDPDAIVRLARTTLVVIDGFTSASTGDAIATTAAPVASRHAIHLRLAKEMPSDSMLRSDAHIARS